MLVSVGRNPWHERYIKHLENIDQESWVNYALSPQKSGVHGVSVDPCKKKVFNKLRILYLHDLALLFIDDSLRSNNRVVVLTLVVLPRPQVVVWAP